MTDEPHVYDKDEPATPSPLAVDLATLTRSIGELHKALQDQAAAVTAALQDQARGTQAAAAEAQQRAVERALQLAQVQPVRTDAAPLGPTLRLRIPNGAPLVDVVSIVAWLTQVFELRVTPPTSLQVPGNLRRYFHGEYENRAARPDNAAERESV